MDKILFFLRHTTYTPIILMVLFVMLCVETAWQLIDTFTLHPTVFNADKNIKTDYHYPINQVHLFGRYAANLDTLPHTTLPFTLEGTVVEMGNPALSHAMIKTAAQHTKVYRVGDALPNNIIISQITKEYVILNNNGQLEKLPLPIQTVK